MFLRRESKRFVYFTHNMYKVVKKLKDMDIVLPENPKFGFIKFRFAQKFHSNIPVSIYSDNVVF